MERKSVCSSALLFSMESMFVCMHMKELWSDLGLLLLPELFSIRGCPDAGDWLKTVLKLYTSSVLVSSSAPSPPSEVAAGRGWRSSRFSVPVLQCRLLLELILCVWFWVPCTGAPRFPFKRCQVFPHRYIFEHKRKSSSFCFLAVLMKLFRTSFRLSSELKVNLTGRGLFVLFLSDGVRFPSRLTSTSFIRVFSSSRILDILFLSSILCPLAFGLFELPCSLKIMRFLLLISLLSISAICSSVWVWAWSSEVWGAACLVQVFSVISYTASFRPCGILPSSIF